MNRTGLFFNIILSILVLIGACNKSNTLTYTGLYRGHVQVKYFAEDSLELDTVYNTIIVVNHYYGYKNNYEIQWNFENFLLLKNKVIRMPNILEVSLDKGIFSPSQNLNLKLSNTDNIPEFYGFFKEDSLVLHFSIADPAMQVSLKAAKIQ